MPQTERFDVVVIGAGVAGFSAATALAERGARVCVVEARPTLGGRAASHRDPVTGDVVDNGQHILMGCYRETFAFLRRVGSDAGVRLQAALEVPIIDRQGARSTLACPALPSPWHLLGGVVEWSALGWRDRLSVVGVGRAIRMEQRRLRGKTERLAASPGETVENWLVRNGQTARVRELLWDPLALAAMNQPPSEAGATAFVRVLADVFGPDARDAAIGLPAVPLSDLFVEPARRFVEARGGAVRANALSRVVVENGRAVGVQPRSGAFVGSDVVISTVPWHALPALFETVPPPLAGVVERAGRMKDYPIVTVNLWFDRPVLDTPFVGLPGREMQWIFDKRALFDGAASHLALIASGAAHLVGRPNRDIVDLALRDVRSAIPSSSAAALRHASVIRERGATFSVAPGEPDRPACATGLPGFFLAGDWTDTSLPGTIESAALSGHRAAHAAGIGDRCGERALRGLVPHPNP
jgi:zeta-carotene desaturase